MPKRPTPTASRIDGRRLRSERTKQLIIEAYLALATEKSPQVPTAAQIAERAGYSVRSVFERFPDIHSLQVAAVDYALVQVAALAPSRDTRRRPADPHPDPGRDARDGPASAGCRCGARSSSTRANSPELKQRIIGLRERLVGRLELMYAPELSTLSDGERRHLLIVLEALIDVESWARMQEFFGLSFDEACAAWTQAIDRLLPPTAACSRSRNVWRQLGAIVTIPSRHATKFATPPESSLPVAPSTSARIDGRRLRSVRTKQLIIEAYLALLRENPQVPTAAQIAERAGYSVRSVFERFPDLHALRVAATDYAFTAGQCPGGAARSRRRPPDAPQGPCRDARLDLRAVAAAVARAQCQPGRFGGAQGAHRVWCARPILKRIELMYRPELATLAERRAPADPDRHRNPDRLRKLGAHAGVSTVSRSRKPAQVWIHAIDRLLPPTPRFLTLRPGKRRKARFVGSDPRWRP